MRNSSWSAFGRMFGRRSLLAGVAGLAGLLAVPSLSSADEIFTADLGAFPVNGPNPLTSFDISWVDRQLVNYFLADRSNAQIDSIPIEALAPSFFIKAPAPNQFAGNVPAAQCADGMANDCSGPNGVVTFFNAAVPGSPLEIWAGDGPTVNPACPSSAPCSTVKVFVGLAALLTAVIPTNGNERADEMCFDPAHNLMMVANDADSPPFLTVISTAGANRFQVVQKINLNFAVGGIEQCVWNPVRQLFFVNLPGASGGDEIISVNPTTFAVTPFKFVNPNECVGLRGLAIRGTGATAGDQMLVGCNGVGPNGQQNSIVIDQFGNTVQVLFGHGGSDEVWSDPDSGHYFIAEGQRANGVAQLGIFDAFSQCFGTPGGPPCGPGFPNVSDIIPSNEDFGVIGQSVFLAFVGSSTLNVHSVAAFSGVVPGLPSTWTIAFVPIPAGPGPGPAPFSSTICGRNGFTNFTRGCIGLIATTPQQPLTVEAAE